MSTPTIDLDNQQLTDLMAELEATTGVTVASVAAPVVKVLEVPADDILVEKDEIAALEEAGSLEPATVVEEKPDASMFSESELLEMDSLNVAKGEKPKADPADLQAQLAALAASAPAGIGEILSPEDPIAGVTDSELNAALSLLDEEIPDDTAPKGTAGPSVEDLMAEVEAGTAAPIPAEAVTAKPVIEPTSEVIEAAATGTLSALAGHFEKKDAGGAAGSGSAGSSAPTTSLRYFVDPAAFKKETAVNNYNLDTCFMEQSSLRAYYGSMAAQAEAQASLSKTKFEVLEARLYDHHRKALAAGGEKTTEKMVENAVKCDPRWLQGKERVIDAESIAAVNKALSVSLADRRDMLIQLGADRRDESKGQARLLAIKEQQEDTANRASAGASALRTQQP